MLESSVFFGRNSITALTEALLNLGLRRPAMIVDENLANVSCYLKMRDQLDSAGLGIVREFKSRSGQEPTYDYLDEVAEKFRSESFDVMIGVGGGSTLDLAKGVAILRTNPGRGIDYRGMDKVKNPGVPVVLVPTTAGTGSEATRTASFEDSDSKLKLGINGRNVGCLFAVLDPAFVVSCPRMPTISAGLDVLVHAFEAVTCKSANAISTVLGKEALRIMFDALPRVAKDLQDVEAREQTLLGSHLAGLAMWNAGGGPASGISYPLGVYHHVPHGFAGGLLLPHVNAFNVSAGYYGYADIYDRLNLSDNGGGSTEEKARALLDETFRIYEEIGAPKTFNMFGLSRDHIPQLTRLTMEQRRANLELNPVTFGEAETSALLEKVID